MAQTKYVDAKDSLNVLNENNKGEQAFYFLSHQINKVIGEKMCIYILLTGYHLLLIWYIKYV